MTVKSTKKQSGFTLVELAIVLVIIGLIVGGVLVGQDLIKAAEIRSAITQFEQYNSTVNTFRTKYNGLPGDLKSTSAVAFGLTARDGANGRGDGDGLIESMGADDATATTAGIGHETGLFWVDLSAASLVADSFTTATDAAGASLAATAVPNYLPSLSIRDTAFVHTYTSGGRNYFQIANVTATSAAGLPTVAAGLTPLEAFQMDDKIDDGSPISGLMIALTGIDTAAVGTTDDACVDGTVAGDPYNTLTEAEQTTIGCYVRVRSQF